MKERMLGNEAIANYGGVCSDRAPIETVAMEAVSIALPGRFSKYFDLKEDAWESALVAVIPGKFIELNKKAFNLGRNF